MKKLLLLALLLLPSGAFAQCNGTMPNNTVCGNVTGSANLPRATSPSAFLGAAGGTNGQIQYNNGGALGGFTTGGDLTFSNPNFTIANKAVTNAKINNGAANTVKGSVDGTTTSDLAVTACSVAYRFTQWISGTGWSCGISPILPSRAIAATLDLSAFSTITTQGYATAGDGGNAAFVKTSGRFLDTVVTSGTITNAGSGYTNGTYLFVPLTGSATGITTYANVTVAGGVVTAVVILDVNGRGAASLVGDVLTTANTNIGGTGANFAWTVSAVTTALASFTDSAGNRFQFIADTNYINPLSFGCKFDWLGVDASATENGPCLQATLNFASITKYARQDLGGTLASTRVVLPAGSAKICQGLVLPGATQLFGQGPLNSVLKVCDTGLNTATHIITVCDQNAHVACFGPQIGQLGINAFNASGGANAWAIFTNAAQQTRFIDNVSIYSGTRGCIKYDLGYGGAALVTFYDVFCTINTGTSNAGIEVGSATGTTLLKFHNTIVESGGAGASTNGFNILGGQVTIDGYHFEGITVGVNVNQTVSTYSTTVMHLTGGGGCTNAVTLQSTNSPGNFALFDAVKQGACANLVLNGQPAGSNRAADARPASCTTGVAGTAGFCVFNP